MYGYAGADKDLWVSNSALLVLTEPLGFFSGLNLNAYVFDPVTHPGNWETYTTSGAWEQMTLMIMISYTRLNAIFAQR